MRTLIEERSAAIPTPDGIMKAFVARPATAGPFAAVVMVQHIGGLSETMKAQARRVAQEGYLCIVPALYHRLGDIVVDPVSTDEAIAAIRTIAVRSLHPTRVMSDIRATLDWLGMEPAVRAGPRGLVSYGGGAALALQAAAEFSGEIGAMASILGVGFIRGDDAHSPHRVLTDVRAELYFGFAGDDEIIPENDVASLAALLAESGSRHRIVVHPGVRHGYVFPDRAAYVTDAAERDWDEIRAIFARTLG